jgi:hypothetical protein
VSERWQISECESPGPNENGVDEALAHVGDVGSVALGWPLDDDSRVGEDDEAEAAE